LSVPNRERRLLMVLLDLQGMAPAASTCGNHSELSVIMCSPPPCSYLSLVLCV
jgi:Lanthionine-containing peptide SapB precursor RamS